jgi:aspartate-semialdehyde dehydrogenase
MRKIRVGILGATGAVGQRFVALLDQHPWFKVSALAASDRSAGKKYVDVVNWTLPTPIPGWAQDMEVQPTRPELDCDIVFSGLDAAVAKEVEWEFAKKGYRVISNARSFRYDPLVPLLIPEANPDHIHILAEQQKRYGFGRGFIVTNPNCSTIGLVLGILPLWLEAGIEKMVVTTLQAVSGAGYPGVAGLDILGNVIPHISGESEKIEKEPLKILGKLEGNSFVEAEIAISAQCNRVPVRDGHLISVSLQLKKKLNLEAIRELYRKFASPLAEWNLPSAPYHPVGLDGSTFQPQPLHKVNSGNGMIVTVGQLRECSVLDVRLVALVHNTIRGAAGGAILNAEWLKVNGYLD